ncbi:Prostaglandin E synthase 2 [Phytophthora pseudosyringae]|uniref:Prostaglandin E synthase 2 n=1 Tax=Phytophthora pseudosyringae TaxID=221518 RepID=A0A8T1V906_9STRA|nr:Prostaglandin E synthase 2 [Phytophthora pseudosyringae]
MLQRGVVRAARGLRPAPAALARPSAPKSFRSHSARFSSGRWRSVAPASASPPLARAGFVAAAAVSTSAACAFCSAPAVETRAASRDGGKALPNVVLYQYEPCPYCCKVKAVLDYLKIPYEVVEVNPLSKKETKAFTDYRKVPVARIDDEVVVDSSAIISRLRELAAVPKDAPQESDEALKEEEQWRQWVDQKLIILTPPNIYRTVPEALQAFDYCLTEGKFTPMERRMAKYAGAVVMYLIAKRSKKKYSIDDERQALYEALNSWVGAIGDKRAFLGGNEPNMADLSVFGVLRAMHGLDTYTDMMRETNIEPWFTRMTAKVGASSRTVSN